MKKFFQGFMIAGLVLSILLLGLSAYGTPSKAVTAKPAAPSANKAAAPAKPSAKPPQYGGTVTFSRGSNSYRPGITPNGPINTLMIRDSIWNT